MKKPSDNVMRQILPAIQRAVQAQIDRWDAEREIEHFFDREFDNMGEGLENMAISFDTGDEVTIEAAREYLEGLGDD